jgi:hypothetical protein
MSSIGTITRLFQNAVLHGFGARIAPVEKQDPSAGVYSRGTHQRPRSVAGLGPEKVVEIWKSAAADALEPGHSPVRRDRLSGSAQSGRLSATKIAIASLLGVSTYPPPASIKIDGRTVMVDLEADSLSMIAARILSQAGERSSLQKAEVGSSTLYRLAVDAKPELAGEAYEAEFQDLREHGRPAMREHFTSIIAVVSRIREQASPLLSEIDALRSDPGTD